MFGSVQTKPEEFENVPLFQRLEQRKRSFSKTLFKQTEFENASFSFPCGRKRLWKVFENDDATIVMRHEISLTKFSSNTNTKLLLRF